MYDQRSEGSGESEESTKSKESKESTESEENSDKRKSISEKPIHENYTVGKKEDKKSSAPCCCLLLCFFPILKWFKRDKKKQTELNEDGVPMTVNNTNIKNIKNIRRSRLRNCLCCTLIVILILLLGDIVALNVLVFRSPAVSPFSPANATQDGSQAKTVACMALLALGRPKIFPCDFCDDENAPPRISNFCALQAVWSNAVNRTEFEVSGWMPDARIDYCSWFGVTCDKNGNVTALFLQTPMVPQILLPSLGELKALKNLSIIGTNKQPTGPIPQTLFKLPALENVLLQFTGLTGAFPEMTSPLKTLNMINNVNLSDSFPPVSNLPLVSMTVSGQNLTGSVPDLIGNSPTLQTTLKILDISQNLLSGSLPSSLTQLKSLQKLNLEGNRLSGGLDIIANSANFQKSITQLFLSANQFTGAIPNSLAQLTSMTTLRLAHNGFTAIPTTFGQNLKDLVVSDNNISGPLPDALGSLGLATLSVANNVGINGPIPASICQRTFSSCDLSGTSLQPPPNSKCSTCTLNVPLAPAAATPAAASPAPATPVPTPSAAATAVPSAR